MYILAYTCILSLGMHAAIGIMTTVATMYGAKTSTPAHKGLTL